MKYIVSLNLLPSRIIHIWTKETKSLAGLEWVMFGVEDAFYTLPPLPKWKEVHILRTEDQEVSVPILPENPSKFPHV